jgi:hypothetical protein
MLQFIFKTGIVVAGFQGLSDGAAPQSSSPAKGRCLSLLRWRGFRRDFWKSRLNRGPLLGPEPFRLGKPSHLPLAGKEYFIES